MPSNLEALRSYSNVGDNSCSSVCDGPTHRSKRNIPESYGDGQDGQESQKRSYKGEATQEMEGNSASEISRGGFASRSPDYNVNAVAQVGNAIVTIVQLLWLHEGVTKNGGRVDIMVTPGPG